MTATNILNQLSITMVTYAEEIKNTREETVNIINKMIVDMDNHEEIRIPEIGYYKDLDITDSAIMDSINI